MDCLIYIDVARAMDQGIPFFRSANNVICSPGPIPPTCFAHVARRSDGVSLLSSLFGAGRAQGTGAAEAADAGNTDAVGQRASNSSRSVACRSLCKEATSLGRLGLLESSLEKASRATELDPEWPIAWSRCGSSLYGLGRPAEALAAFRRALTSPAWGDVPQSRRTVELTLVHEHIAKIEASTKQNATASVSGSAVQAQASSEASGAQASPEAAHLIAMGFPPDKVNAALAANKNNEEAALNVLLNL